MTAVTPPPLSPDTDQLVQPVLITVPELTAGSQILVMHQPWGVEVCVRADSYGTWCPASLAGLDVQARPC